MMDKLRSKPKDHFQVYQKDRHKAEVSDKEHELKRKAKYSIEIKRPAWKGYKYALHYSKEYGDSSGGATEFKTKQELLDFIKKQFDEWSSRWDGIVERKPDKVTPKNLYFKSFTDDITKMELFGDRQLFSFFDETK